MRPSRTYRSRPHCVVRVADGADRLAHLDPGVVPGDLGLQPAFRVVHVILSSTAASAGALQSRAAARSRAERLRQRAGAAHVAQQVEAYQPPGPRSRAPRASRRRSLDVDRVRRGERTAAGEQQVADVLDVAGDAAAGTRRARPAMVRPGDRAPAGGRSTTERHDDALAAQRVERARDVAGGEQPGRRRRAQLLVDVERRRRWSRPLPVEEAQVGARAGADHDEVEGLGTRRPPERRRHRRGARRGASDGVASLQTLSAARGSGRGRGPQVRARRPRRTPGAPRAAARGASRSTMTTSRPALPQDARDLDAGERGAQDERARRRVRRPRARARPRRRRAAAPRRRTSAARTRRGRRGRAPAAATVVAPVATRHATVGEAARRPRS